MKIRVTLHSTHPHFGGHRIESWDYGMTEGEKAEAHYRKLVGEIGTSGYAQVEIAVIHTS
jgi:hypothetical protein